MQSSSFNFRRYLSRIPSLGRSTQALVTGLGAGLILMSGFAVAAEVGLLPESHRPRPWHWFLVSSVAGLATVGGISKLEQLQVAQGRQTPRTGWFSRVCPNGSLYEQTTTQLAVHLLELEPGTAEFQQFTVAGSEMLGHVERVHGSGSVQPVQTVQPVRSVPDSTPPAGDALAALSAINQIVERQHVKGTESAVGGNSSGEIDDCVAAITDPWTDSAAPHATVPAPGPIENSFFGRIEP